MNIWIGPTAPLDDTWDWQRSIPKSLSFARGADKIALAWDTGTEGVTGMDCILILARKAIYPRVAFVVYEKDAARLAEMTTALKARYAGVTDIETV